MVETRDGTLRFRLARHRINGKVMNKFHVNIPESSRPQTASLVCGGKVLDRKPIAAPATKPVFTVTPAP